MSKKYHKVKFFGTPISSLIIDHYGPYTSFTYSERRKVERKIKQLKKQLEATTDKQERKRMEDDLLTLRVDLNYVLVWN